MKILHIITSGRCWAGMEQYAFDVAEAMKCGSDEVCFVVATDGDLVVPRYEALGKVYRLPMKSKFDFASIRALREIVRTEQPDIIHTHQPKNIFHAHRARKGCGRNTAVVHTVHFAINKTSPQWLYSYIFALPQRVIAVSERVRRRAMEVYPNLKSEQVVTILNSVNPSRLSAVEAVKGGEPIVFGFAGRLVRDKGIHVFIKAAGTIARAGYDFRLLVAGRGDEAYADELKRLAADEGIADKVRFLGFIDRIGEFIESIDVAVLPSIVSEAGSLMLVEYMCAGRAVITTSNGAQGEVVDDSVNGFLVPPDDVEALAAKLSVIAGNPALAREMGHAARNRYEERLSFDKFVENTRNTYLEALK